MAHAACDLGSLSTEARPTETFCEPAWKSRKWFTTTEIGAVQSLECWVPTDLYLQSRQETGTRVKGVQRGLLGKAFC
jgi:hypothetical protein